ncbi:bifunctional 3-deoxy-7-phosphoheptulonate synthase/chorismate mutase type II [Persicobacter sp. CCB-QB2]|uniref:bifunctional 3-deoxy-7-phosphoheptulonate synthase/chorismate mutase type II n=1 Tax=Persicobacter sp. CCB-QB2 TaxID=1561025 RepID=UPI0006A9ED08|nr:bifunctional 3-deoxy-7-phosphoheptulonate synthase/chorismate mutase type II [Persicobacter sp. CCB-QB2]
MQIEQLSAWTDGSDQPFIIAGPCSAETEEQLFQTAKELKENGINVIRAGVWKPRTRPGTFEGIGEDALKWIQKIKKELDVKFAIEVANAQHVELALKYGIDILWIGARSTVNPFTVQEIADALKGHDVPVLVKNPLNPDLALWIGAMERLNQAGITKLGAIHRGFSTSKKTKFRNLPQWQMALELKRKYPEMPMICDPSHIAGKRDMIQELSQKAMDLVFDGLIIESHIDPENAWSDAAQQVTPTHLKEILEALVLRHTKSDNPEFQTHLAELREKIDELDREIFETLADRMKIVDEIGEYKKDNKVTVFQINRYKEMMKARGEWAEELHLNDEFMENVFSLIHDAAIRRQTLIMNETEEKA